MGATTTERGRLSPRRRLSPGSTATDLDISAMASATMVWATAATTTARGRLSPRLRPSPTTMVDTDSDTTDLATALATVAMEDTTTARGRPSLRLLLTPTCFTVASTAMDSATATATVLAAT